MVSDRGWPVTFGGRRFRLDPAKYFEVDAPPERPDPTDGEQMRELLRAVTGAAGGDAEGSDDGG